MINGDLYLVTASIGKRYVDGKELHTGVVIGCSKDCPENGEKPFKDCNLNGYQNSYRWVEEFAKDQAKWAKAFGKAYERMLGEAFSSCYILILTSLQLFYGIVSMFLHFQPTATKMVN